jgi:SAM-dependent methyltransferase
MIQVLQNWLEIGEATLFLQHHRLPTHITVQKNWDQFLLSQRLLKIPKQSAIIDLGCGDCCTLKLLTSMGFTHLSGIDLQLPASTSPLPYQLYQGNLINTPFKTQSFDGAISISVLEHGVELRDFFQEANRILKPNGLLFITTDYWEEKVEVDASIQPFGLPWQIFSKAQIQDLIQIAQACGFTLKQETTIPACVDKTVTWYGKDYTFIALTLCKTSASDRNEGYHSPGS